MVPQSKQRRHGITCLISFLKCYSLVFWLTGVVLLGVGIWAKFSAGFPDFLQQYINQYPLSADITKDGPYLLIGIGITIIILGLFGCLATCHRKPSMLKVYAFFSVIVFFGEVAAGISGFLNKDKLANTVVVAYRTAFWSYNISDSNMAIVDYTQKNLKCCGVTNYTDWGRTAYFTDHGLPHSCCKVRALCIRENLKNLTAVQDKVHNYGCVGKVTKAFNSNAIMFGTIAFTIASFQLLGIFLTWCFAQHIIKSQYKMF